MAQFYTNEAVSLEKEVNTSGKSVCIPDEEFHSYYDIDRCAQWIRDNKYTKVCLQFPDYLLPDSTKVCKKLQEVLNQRIFILGDTSYGSCCLDYVAAAHVDADAIIHFGGKCFSKPSNDIPSLFIYEKYNLDLESFYSSFQELLSHNEQSKILILDTPYVHYLKKLQDIFADNSVSIIEIDNLEDIIEDLIVYIGVNDKKLLNFKFTFRDKQMYLYDESSNKSIQQYDINNIILKRRFYLIEKVKDSKTVGIIIGTVAVKNYLDVINRIKRLLTIYKKKYYLISVGKPTVAKLANFPEMDVYVLIGCAMNELHDSKDFYKPIVTPCDVEIALNPSSTTEFNYDFNRLIMNNDDLSTLEKSDTLRNSDVSLLTGAIRSMEDDNIELSECNGTVSIRASNTVALADTHGAGYLAQKSWKGLEQNLGQTEVKLAEDGRKGIAQGYANEIDM